MSATGRPGVADPKPLLVRREGILLSLQGFVIESIESGVVVSAVPGSTFAMAFVRGQVVPVLCLGTARAHLIVGRVRGEVIALTGLEVIGFRPSSDDGFPSVPFDVVGCLETAKTEIH